jgi:hypothetical protein
MKVLLCKPKKPEIYDAFFGMFSDEFTSRMGATVFINTVFIEMLISSLISVITIYRVLLLRKENSHYSNIILL